MKLFVIEQRDLWGDYGHALISGYIKRGGPDSPLLLHRAGPFLPPISFPWSSTLGRRVIVADDFRDELEKAGFPGLQFRLAVKDRIVRLPWEHWDRTASEPEHFPPGGEPEGFVWHGTHDARAADGMPDAWELLPPVVTMKFLRAKGPDGHYLDRFHASPKLDDHPPLFSNREGWGELVVGEAARGWFEERVGEWITLRDVELTDS